ncbi:ParA family protein [Chitinimonas sp. BJB300]|uniref:ParA family protein n=1 Tax=Chitinimonas sp. BJB300 TaxID=1559339 RepID=UPI000C0DE8D7|nr:ParA family protein [Chitinimonas sp. BJB300]PHV11785.1 cobyrinic acid a,c-diamide synthase [Chitinimonas sp. BJB300]TSJ91215.1 ParA family protein [Chitinimonas sp. BJB300]
MQTILIANPKGGAGKSTLATNLATYFAWQGHKVVLGDTDRQQSTAYWLSLRSHNFPSIGTWDCSEELPTKPAKDCEKAIIDTPAGLRGKKLEVALKLSDHILVPVQPSSFDMWASQDFFARLAEEKRVRKGKVSVGVVGMRVKANTRASQQLIDFLAQFELPVLSCLRDTQYYLQTLPRGMGIFDLPVTRVARDLEQWQPILKWLEE